MKDEMNQIAQSPTVFKEPEMDTNMNRDQIFHKPLIFEGSLIIYCQIKAKPFNFTRVRSTIVAIYLIKLYSTINICYWEVHCLSNLHIHNP